VLTHVSRQSPSWLVSDVRQKDEDAKSVFIACALDRDSAPCARHAVVPEFSSFPLVGIMGTAESKSRVGQVLEHTIFVPRLGERWQLLMAYLRAAIQKK